MIRARLLVSAVLFAGACATPSSPPPADPLRRAKELAIEGTVVLKVSTDEKGDVTHVEVLEGPGFGLNEAAAEALRKFKFKPATKDGVPVPYTFIYRYTFLSD